MEDYDVTKPCTCCGGPRPCPCETLAYNEYMSKSSKSTKSNGQKKSSSSSDTIVDDSTDVFYTSPTKK